jgi:hypothetical protein
MKIMTFVLAVLLIFCVVGAASADTNLYSATYAECFSAPVDLNTSWGQEPGINVIPGTNGVFPLPKCTP